MEQALRKSFRNNAFAACATHLLPAIALLGFAPLHPTYIFNVPPTAIYFFFFARFASFSTASHSDFLTGWTDRREPFRISSISASALTPVS
ncbi:hypothetical protein Enr8_29020 [Blastopirellula retiformator]|uniref:Uncharacterized protein n=1 Tax=Blastopirellula retiformator TaxID=2527970 RepID=A0A5C5V5Q6_9BACT|nr:hypothetical protein Enr8_29020 [Blastopirellula retiformator]